MTVRNDKSPKMSTTLTMSRKRTKKTTVYNTDMPLWAPVPVRFTMPRYGPRYIAHKSQQCWLVLPD